MKKLAKILILPITIPYALFVILTTDWSFLDERKGLFGEQ